MRRSETEIACHLILQILDIGRKELDHLAAMRADHVVMMLVIVVVLIVGFVIAKPDLACETRLCQQLQRAIYGRQTDGRIFFMDEIVKIFAREMFLGAQKDLEYQVALIGASQTGRLYVFRKDRTLSFKIVFLACQNYSP